VFLSKTTSGSDSQRWSKHGWRRSSPSTPLKLAVIACPVSTFHSVMLSSFDICCLMLRIALFYICIWLHMLVSASFSHVFWSGDSVLFQKMHNSAPYCITVKTLKAQKFESMVGKELTYLNLVSPIKIICFNLKILSSTLPYFVNIALLHAKIIIDRPLIKTFSLLE